MNGFNDQLDVSINSPFATINYFITLIYFK